MRFPIPEPGSPIDRVATVVMVNMVWAFFGALLGGVAVSLQESLASNNTMQILLTLLLGLVFLFVTSAATAGLFAVLAPLVRGRDTDFFFTFFGTMRRQWRKAGALGLLDLAFTALVLFNLAAVSRMEGDGVAPTITWALRSITLLVALTLLLTNVYLWPLLVLFDLRLRRLLVVSLQLALAHPLRSLLSLTLGLLPLVLGLMLPVWLYALGLVSASALGINWGSWRVIRMRASAEEMAELDDPMKG